jgi:glycerol-3-phosphate acyltransferase PlsY
MTEQILLLLFVYFFSAIPFGVVVSRFVLGKDVRSQGSGNIGATNVSRMMGKKWGLFVLFLDGLKGFVSVAICAPYGLAQWAALVSILGHCFPIYLKFKGGKGVATGAGVVAALSGQLFLGVMVVFFAAFLLSRRVSVGSLLAAASMPLLVLIMKLPHDWTFLFAIALVIWWRHKENIQRLLKGAEPRYF